MKNIKNTGPEFIKVSAQLLADKSITPLDKIVYGVIIWYTGLGNGNCTASNQSIADITFSTVGSVKNSLNRLESKKYIKRIFSGTSRNFRSEIIPLTLAKKSGKSVKNDIILGSSNNATPRHQLVTTPSLTDDTPSLTDDGTSDSNKSGINHIEQGYNDEKEVKVGSLDSAERESIGRIDSKNSRVEYIFGHSDTKIENVFDNGKIESLPSKNGNILSSAPENTTPHEKPSDKDKTLNDVIALFLPLLPGDFIGKSTAFSKPPTRDAVGALMQRYTYAEIKNLIDKYAEGKSDQFRPQVGTVYEFCASKLAKVEAYVSKKPANELWGQKSISTPEQGKKRDEQYNAVIEKAREKTRKAKEEYEANKNK